MRIYLAASSRHGERVRRWAAALRVEGHELTSDWMDGCEQWSGRDGERSQDEGERIALDLLRAIDRADIVWVLMPDVYSGALVELGYAIGKGKLTIVSGQSATIFSSMTTCFDLPGDGANEQAALEYIRAISHRRSENETV